MPGRIMNVYLEEKRIWLHPKLAEIAKKESRSLSHVVGDACEKYVDEYDAKSVNGKSENSVKS